ncbi:asparagine synthase (glutamine-hydrolyzing) [Sphaerisporangium fuscum]|uniref:asparagine synthase (glutamine-hydrolyzing) n=1 Tax=Sphaerisporangium fuscum TaxID=2835868 RepID=UPI001BDCCF70|nr:asparagine synthase (glutamine-hydrolyzing) [Sphaerisporangium fuscum]
MCGIAGTVGTTGAGAVEQMTLALSHRGPDGRGWTGAGAARVGATRLAIVDPAAGSQPISDETGTIHLVFNGEIYNHRELRAELAARGHRFRTRCDSEVVLHLYEEHGEGCVQRLRGMFAFAVLHGDRLFLARDRLGIKPLYYALVPETPAFLFASEAKAILPRLGRRPRLDRQAFADLVVLGHLVGDQTLFDGVRALPPGHTMRVSFAGALQVEPPAPYHSSDSARDDAMTYEEAEERLAAAFEDAVRTHLAADVEVGFTLSGGIDSTLLALFAREQTDLPLRTFTVADHAEHPDIVQAETVAKLIGSDHRTCVLDAGSYLETIPALVRSEEGPASLFGASFQYLCGRIAGEVKACVHGEGADELFGGYPEYLDRGYRARSFQRRLGLLKRLGTAPSDLAAQTIVRLSAAGPFDEHLRAVFEVNLGDPLQRLHLDVVDRCAMSAGLEMRVPYLDDPMVELARRIPLRHLVRADIGVRKYILRRLALRRFAPVYGPAVVDVVLREKLGAPSSGVRRLQEFDQLCESRLPGDYLDRHELGFCFTAKRQLLMFEYFCEAFMEHHGDVDAVGGILDFIESRARCRP